MGFFKSKEQKRSEERLRIAQGLRTARGYARAGNVKETQTHLDTVLRTVKRSNFSDDYTQDLYKGIVPKSIEHEQLNEIKRKATPSRLLSYSFDESSIEQAVETVSQAYADAGKDCDEQAVRHRLYRTIMKPLFGIIETHVNNGNVNNFEDLEERILHYARKSKAPEARLAGLTQELMLAKGQVYANKAGLLMNEMVQLHKSGKAGPDLMPAVEQCVEQANTYVPDGNLEIKQGTYALAADVLIRQLFAPRVHAEGVAEFDQAVQSVRDYAAKAGFEGERKEKVEQKLSAIIKATHTMVGQLLPKIIETKNQKFFDRAAGFYVGFAKHYADILGVTPEEAEATVNNYRTQLDSTGQKGYHATSQEEMWTLLGGGSIDTSFNDIVKPKDYGQKE